MKNIFKYAFGTIMIITITSYLYVNYFPKQRLDESKQKDIALIEDKFKKSHSLIYMSCQGKEFADFLSFAKDKTLDIKKSFLLFIQENNPRDIKTIFQNIVNENIPELIDYYEKEIAVKQQAWDIFGTKDRDLMHLKSLSINDMVFASSDTFGMFDIGVLLYEYKECTYEDISEEQSKLTYKIPSDFKFLIDTTNIEETAFYQSDEIPIGSLLFGEGTIVDLNRCQENGHINKNCYRMSVLNGDTLVSILTKPLNIKQQMKYKPGTNINYSNCVLTEVDNPRGVAGTQWNDFIEDMSPEINKAVESGVSTYTLTGDYASGAIAFGMQLLSKIDKPKYVYSLTCEINEKYIDILF